MAHLLLLHQFFHDGRNIEETFTLSVVLHRVVYLLFSSCIKFALNTAIANIDTIIAKMSFMHAAGRCDHVCSLILL